jgi:hypothetical protein
VVRVIFGKLRCSFNHRLVVRDKLDSFAEWNGNASSSPFVATRLQEACVRRLRAQCNKLLVANSRVLCTAALAPNWPTYTVVLRPQVDSGYLKHVFEMFDSYGFERGSLESGEWDVLWAHDYPFRVMKDKLTMLKRTQRVSIQCALCTHRSYIPSLTRCLQ